MSLNQNSESIVKLHTLFFNEIDFWRSGKKILKSELKLNFAKSYEFDDEHKHCIVHLACNLHDKDSEALKLHITITGEFTCDDPDDSRRDTLLKKNTLAILFPYVRSQISIVTSQPGMTPIVLPPMNINAIFAESENE